MHHGRAANEPVNQQYRFFIGIDWAKEEHTIFVQSETVAWPRAQLAAIWRWLNPWSAKRRTAFNLLIDNLFCVSVRS